MSQILSQFLYVYHSLSLSLSLTTPLISLPYINYPHSHVPIESQSYILPTTTTNPLLSFPSCTHLYLSPTRSNLLVSRFLLVPLPYNQTTFTSPPSPKTHVSTPYLVIHPVSSVPYTPHSLRTSPSASSNGLLILPINSSTLPAQMFFTFTSAFHASSESSKNKD